MLPHPTPSMEPPFFMQASMETRRSHQEGREIEEKENEVKKKMMEKVVEKQSV